MMSVFFPTPFWNGMIFPTWWLLQYICSLKEWLVAFIETSRSSLTLMYTNTYYGKLYKIHLQFSQVELVSPCNWALLFYQTHLPWQYLRDRAYQQLLALLQSVLPNAHVFLRTVISWAVSILRIIHLQNIALTTVCTHYIITVFSLLSSWAPKVPSSPSTCHAMCIDMGFSFAGKLLLNVAILKAPSIASSHSPYFL